MKLVNTAARRMNQLSKLNGNQTGPNGFARPLFLWQPAHEGVSGIIYPLRSVTWRLGFMRPHILRALGLGLLKSKYELYGNRSCGP